MSSERSPDETAQDKHVSVSDKVSFSDKVTATVIKGGQKPPPSKEDGAKQNSERARSEAAVDTSRTFQSNSSQAPEEEASRPTIPGGIPIASADRPTAEDKLGRKPLVHTLAGLLASSNQSLPITIALLGDWGAGKSSVIEQLTERLRLITEIDQRATEKPTCFTRWRKRFRALPSGDEKDSRGRRRCHYLVAVFNAWEYEQTKNIRAGLAQQVVRGLTSGLSWAEKFRLAVKNAATQHGWEFYRVVAGLLVTSISLGIGALNVDKLGSLNSFQSLLGTGTAAALIFAFVRTWQQARRLLEHPLAERLSTYLRLPNYGEHLGEVPVIKSEIKSLCNARLETIPNGRLLVIVDDLDRCHPKAIIDTLDAIRLVMDLENVAVILAIDDRIAFRAVAEHYKELADGSRTKEEIARDYLGKIIQIPVNLYDPQTEHIKAFVEQALFPKDAEKSNSESPRRDKNDIQTAERETDITDELMRDTSVEQRLFVELVGHFGYSNPRQLIPYHYPHLSGDRVALGWTHGAASVEMQPHHN
ncbi:MAG: P-loop NTPase fold protein [Pseudomonadota bacterium]|nr:P-loop NTPase fold protein [Pseudomonadota bacterium]